MRTSWTVFLAALSLVIGTLVAVHFWDPRQQQDTSPYVDQLSSIQEGDHVRLKKRTYDLRETLEIPAGAHVDGNGSTFRYRGDRSVAVSLSTGSVLEDIDVVARDQSRAAVIIPRGAHTVKLQHVDIKSNKHQRSGILFAGDSSGIEVSDTRVLDAQNGIQIKGRNDDISLSGLSIRGWTYRGIRVQGGNGGATTHLEIRDTTIGENAGSGRSRQQVTVRSPGTSRHKKIAIVNVRVRGRGTSFSDKERPGTGDQISVVDANHVLISGCRSIDGGERGINVNSATNVRIVGNVVKRSESVGIGVGSLARGKNVRRVQVTQNRVIDAGGAKMEDTTDYSLSGIRLTNAIGASVSDNVVRKSMRRDKPRYGIVMDSVRAATVENNSISGSFDRKVLTATKSERNGSKK